MRLGTILKFGSLAFGVAQDEKVRELLKLAHNGAKRRGLYNGLSSPGMYSSRPGRPMSQGPRRPW